MAPLRTYAPAAWLASLLVLPAAAYVGGVRQEQVEQRPKEPFPAFNRSSLPNEKTYPRIERAVLDRLPLRSAALSVRGHLALDVFGRSPSEQVLLGDGRWLFFRDELRACSDARPVVSTADAMSLMALSSVASGRRTLVTLAGSKMVAERRRLRSEGFSRTDLDCVRQLEAEVHERLGQTPGGVDLRAPMAAAARLAPAGSAYYRYDTHWNGAGQAVFARAVAEAVRPGLAAAAKLGPGPETVSHAGDLGRLMGVPLSEPYTPPAAPTRPAGEPAGKGVVLIGDSQLEAAFTRRPTSNPALIDQLLPSAVHCTRDEYADGRCDDAMRRSTSFVYETVGRNAKEIGDGCWRAVSVLTERLGGRPSAYAIGGRRIAAPTVTVGASGQLPASVIPAGGARSPHPRLLQIPVVSFPAGAADAKVALIQQPVGELSPCVTPEQKVPGRVLTLPVPASRDAATYRVVLQAPPGTVLGRPEEIVLDGTRQPDRR